MWEEILGWGSHRRKHQHGPETAGRVRRAGIFGRSGFTLPEILVSAGMLSLIAMTAGAILFLGKDRKEKLETFGELLSMKGGLVSALQDRSAFKYSYADPANASLACLRTQTSCAGQGGLFLPRDAMNRVVEQANSPTNPNEGLNWKGQKCASFGIAGDTACPFRYEVSWQAVCPAGGGGCLTPAIRLTANFRTNLTPAMAKKYRFNFKDLSASFMLSEIDQSANTAQTNCISLGGTWDAVNSICTLRLNGGSCPWGWVIRGFDAYGGYRCALMNPVSCALGTVLLGIDASGNFICGSGCAVGGVNTSFSFSF